MHKRVCRSLCLCNPLRAKQTETVNHIIYFHEMYPPYRYACHYTIEREILKTKGLPIRQPNERNMNKFP